MLAQGIGDLQRTNRAVAGVDRGHTEVAQPLPAARDHSGILRNAPKPANTDTLRMLAPPENGKDNLLPGRMTQERLNPRPSRH